LNSRRGYLSEFQSLLHSHSFDNIWIWKKIFLREKNFNRFKAFQYWAITISFRRWGEKMTEWSQITSQAIGVLTGIEYLDQIIFLITELERMFHSIIHVDKCQKVVKYQVYFRHFGYLFCELFHENLKNNEQLSIYAFYVLPWPFVSKIACQGI